MRKLVITELAKKDLISLDKAIQKRVQTALDKMIDDPKSVTIKKLEGEPEEWGLRVGNWRVILYFDWDERVVYVDRIKHRGKVYLNRGRRQRR